MNVVECERVTQFLKALEETTRKCVYKWEQETYMDNPCDVLIHVAKDMSKQWDVFLEYMEDVKVNQADRAKEIFEKEWK